MSFMLYLITFFTFISSVTASSYININGKTYQPSNNGSISIVNGVVIEGNVISGNAIKGNKKVSTTSRKLTQFNHLTINLNADIEIIQSDSPSIEISADENILPLISSNINNKHLVLATNKNYWTTQGIKIRLSTNTLSTIKIEGSANLEMKNIKQNKLELYINGAGDAFVSGKVDKLVAIIDGSGDLNLENLKSKTAVAKIQGAGDIKVYATEKLTAEINGSGDISYTGNPKKLKKSISGSGDIDEL